MAALAELHQLMDAGRIGDEDFNARESDLLDRLDTCREIRGTGRSAGGGRPPLPSPAQGGRAAPPAETRDNDMHYEPALSRQTDNTVLELLDRVLNTGVVLVGDVAITVADIELVLPPLAVAAQLGGDRPAGGMAGAQAALGPAANAAGLGSGEE